MKDELLFTYNERKAGWALQKQLDNTFGISDSNRPSIFLFKQHTMTNFDLIKFEPENDKIEKDSLTIDRIKNFVSDFKKGKLSFEKDGQVNVELIVHESDYLEKKEGL